ncbi:MAG TPA: M20/M25/M40 family metallo-hydrolase [Methanospirillum sp.]|nr:M20/M25/M40 family metallo-hydrolase [Methanospirillum sp.]
MKRIRETLKLVLGKGARGYLVGLTDQIGSRLPGSHGEEQGAEYIRSALSASGYAVQEQEFTFTNEEEEDLTSKNLIAVKPGVSPREIIVGAHYDSTDDGEGADDNAGGVAILLAVAEELKSVSTPYTIRFVAFGAEEADLDGSRFFVNQMDAIEKNDTVGMINLDSLIAGDIVYLYGDSGVTVRDQILKAADHETFSLETRTARELDDDDGTPCECADYGPFQSVGIPFAFMEATNWNNGDADGLTQVDPSKGEGGVIRHTSFDTVRYIDSAFPGRIDKRLSGITNLLVTTLTEDSV